MFDKIKEIAAGYEPALVASIVAAVFVLAAGLGVTLAQWSDEADAVLTFLAFIAPILAGGYTRSKVTPLARYRAE